MNDGKINLHCPTGFEFTGTQKTSEEVSESGELCLLIRKDVIAVVNKGTISFEGSGGRGKNPQGEKLEVKKNYSYYELKRAA